MNPEVKLGELYQEVILDHNKKPRNFGKIEQANHSAHGKNPLCGDDYFLYLDVDPNGIIQKIGFEGAGCAISKASASLMTTVVLGKNVQEAQVLKNNFIHLLTDQSVDDAVRQGVGKLKFFEGVKHFPVRVKCATLAWRALEAALETKNSEVSTE